MRLRLKAKLTALISLLVLLVVVSTSTVYISNLTHQGMVEVQNKGEYVAQEVYQQARTVLAERPMPAGASPADYQALLLVVQQRLSSDAGLASLIESAVGYSPTLYYLTITDTHGLILVHNDPGEEGDYIAPAPKYSSLMHAGTLQQLQVIYGRAQRL